jgi:hypothetical protein
MTRGELRTAILYRLGVSATDTSAATQINNFLNVEYQRLAAEEKLFQKVTTLALVADYEVVDLPDDCQRIHQIVDSSGGVAIRPITALEWADNNDWEGRMVYWAFAPDRILVRPTPATSRPQGLTLIYTARPDAMATDGASPTALPVEFHDLLVELVLIKMFLSEENPDLASAAQAQAQGLLDRLRAHRKVKDGDYIGKMVLPPVLKRHGRVWK